MVRRHHFTKTWTSLLWGIGLGFASPSLAQSPIPPTAFPLPTPRIQHTPYWVHLATALVSNYRQKQPALSPPGSLTLRQAQQIRTLFIQALQPQMGPIVGYKAALTNPKAQAQFQVQHPLRGMLLQQMLLPSGATVDPNFGTFPLSEGDLMVRVGSEAINTASSRAEILAALDAVIPFIELPDRVYGNAKGLRAPALVAINAGARLGVMGEAIALEPTPDWEARLGQIHLDILDTQGTVLASGESNALLGHPLEAVRWLRDDLRAAGIQLKPGDLLSLGTMTPLVPVQPNSRIRARYTGLGDEPLEVVVQVGRIDGR